MKHSRTLSWVARTLFVTGLLCNAYISQAEAIKDSIYTTGTPHCVGKTSELLSNELILRVSEILDNELKDHGGHELIKGGKNMTISDCESFYTVMLVPPPKDGMRLVIFDGFYAIYFFKQQYLDPFSGQYLVVYH